MTDEAMDCADLMVARALAAWGGWKPGEPLWSGLPPRGARGSFINTTRAKIVAARQMVLAWSDGGEDVTEEMERAVVEAVKSVDPAKLAKWVLWFGALAVALLKWIGENPHPSVPPRA